MWWPFKKKEEDKWKDLHESLKKSFLNVRKDIEEIKLSIERHDSSISNIKGLLSGIKNKAKEVEEKIELEPIGEQLTENLTNLQKSLLLQLKILSNESAQEWISMKYLTQELYPQKNYNDVKSMISNYTDALLQLGLIQKKRKGRQIHLSLTPKADEILPERANLIKRKAK